MLKIVWNHGIRDEIVANSRKGIHKQIWLVPEPFSHETERALCQAGGDGISLSCEVLSFQRLAHRILARAGGLAEPQLDAGGRVLLLARALSVTRGQLSGWGRRAAEPKLTFLTQLLATIDELKLHRAPPECLTLDEDDPSRGKLADIRLIWEAFDYLTTLTALDPRDRLSRAAEKAGDYARGAKLYIDGFISMTAQEYAVIRAFLQHADSVTVAIDGDPKSKEEHFRQPQQLAERLKRCAAEVGCEVAEELHDSERKPTTTILCAAADPASECEWAAKLARSWVDEGGCRFGDIVIAAADWNACRGLLESACERYGIPLYADKLSPISGKAAARFIAASLSIAVGGFDGDEVINLLKTGLTRLSDDQCFRLENYIRANDIVNKHWTKNISWTAKPRDSSDLDDINASRETLRAPLITLRTALKRAENGGDMVRALYDYFERAELPQALERQCARMEARGFLQQADENIQLWDCVCRAMDGCADILGGTAVSAEEFGRLFTLCLSSFDVGTIPVALDRLQAGPIDRLRRRDLKRLILIGAAESKLPAVSEPAGLLTDAERILIEGRGASLSPTADERAGRELFTIYQRLTLPGEKLAVSYPEFAEGAAQRPSIVFARLGEITERFELKSGRVKRRLSQRGALSDYGVLLSQSGKLSASRVQTYQTCRFQYFMKYGLNARVRPRVGPQPADAGLLLHHVLKVMVDRMIAQPLTQEEAVTVAERAADEYIAALPGAELRSARASALFDRLRKTAALVAGTVWDELNGSDFSPERTEYKFDADAGGIPMTGFIDRVDRYGEYVRVVDYKSGAAEFSLRDVWNGLGTQMLCYLFALEEDTPAGVLYTHIGDRFKNDGDRERKPDGIALKAVGGDLDFPQMRVLKRHIRQTLADMADAVREGSVAALPTSDGAGERACEYCDFTDACWFDAEREGCRALLPMKPEEVWAKLEESYAD
ncbi:hypothetical protein FACS1894202_02200 [Clostridia bacterium]|nr:hypothetical protein FACS1894202_02200 [Clostridia bacterium]